MRLSDSRIACAKATGTFVSATRDEWKKAQMEEQPSFGDIYAKLAYYEGLEEQGRLAILPPK